MWRPAGLRLRIQEQIQHLESAARPSRRLPYGAGKAGRPRRGRAARKVVNYRRLKEGKMSSGGEQKKLPLVLRLHNLTCPVWRLRIGVLQKLEPGCRMVQRRLGPKA